MSSAIEVILASGEKITVTEETSLEEEFGKLGGWTADSDFVEPLVYPHEGIAECEFSSPYVWWTEDEDEDKDKDGVCIGYVFEQDLSDEPAHLYGFAWFFVEVDTFDGRIGFSSEHDSLLPGSPYFSGEQLTALGKARVFEAADRIREDPEDITIILGELFPDVEFTEEDGYPTEYEEHEEYEEYEEYVGYECFDSFPN